MSTKSNRDVSPITCIVNLGVRSGIHVLVCFGKFWDSTIRYSNTYILKSSISEPVVTSFDSGEIVRR